MYYAYALPCDDKVSVSHQFKNMGRYGAVYSSVPQVVYMRLALNCIWSGADRFAWPKSVRTTRPPAFQEIVYCFQQLTRNDGAFDVVEMAIWSLGVNVREKIAASNQFLDYVAAQMLVRSAVALEMR